MVTIIIETIELTNDEIDSLISAIHRTQKPLIKKIWCE